MTRINAAPHAWKLRGLVSAFLGAIALTTAASSCSGSVHNPIQGATSGYNPNNTQDIRLESGDTQVEIISGHPYTARITAHNNTKTLMLPIELHQVDSTNLFLKRKIVVEGMITGSASIVIIIDIDRIRIVDSFWCYFPAIAPSGQYAAFVKFFPEHGVDGADDHYMIYDVARSPAENRPTRDVKDNIDVGVSVFPASAGNRPGDNVEVPSEQVHTIESQFFWSPDSTGYIFMDNSHGYSRVVEVHAVDSTFSTSSASLPTEISCNPGEQGCTVRLTRVIYPRDLGKPIELAVTRSGARGGSRKAYLSRSKQGEIYIY